jgi:hypothetical protein
MVRFDVRLFSMTGLARMKKWLVWVIVGGPVVVYAIGKFLSR